MDDYQKIAGNWFLTDYVFITSDGDKYAPWGENFAGHITYGENNTMSVQIMRSDRRHFVGPDVLQGFPEETKEAFDGYIAYWGKFALNTEEKYVTHFLEGCLFPNWINTEFRRYYRFEEGLLVLETAPLLFNGRQCVATLKWRR